MNHAHPDPLPSQIGSQWGKVTVVILNEVKNLTWSVILNGVKELESSFTLFRRFFG